MIHENLLNLLRCPQDGSRLALAPPELLTELNRQVNAGTLRNSGDAVVEKPLQGGLVRESGDLLYPIIDDIPVMLVDEAIAIAPGTVGLAAR